MQAGNNSPRTFQDAPAVRGPTPLLLGIIGPSGSGKTYSALRLATGFQRCTGGNIFLIDTESRRSLHYAKNFAFRHVEFKAPFSPLDYLDAIEYCLKKGAKTIIVDSMSHEHEGPGGVLEWHAQEVERIMKAWGCSEDKANIPAWNKPKAARRRLINSIIQMDANFIFCFRAKDKVKIGGGKVTQQGFMPIAGEEFVFELTAKCLLLPGANGVPTWKSDNIGEQLMIKLPEQFKEIFSGAAGKSLDENIGQSLAEWAAGDDATATVVAPTIAEYEACADQAALDVLEKRRADKWKATPPAVKTQLKAAADAAQKRIKQTPTSSPAETGESLLGKSTSLLQSSQTLDALVAAWDSICTDYEAAGRDIDIEVEGLYNDRKAAFEQL
jgi:ABC-type dipeptide/oligopeptide/nickel transport system ATPase subunit